jgi:hypothetical protein
MNNKEYNGWVNYATWRVNSDFFSCDQDYPKDYNNFTTAELLEGHVYELTFMDISTDTIAAEYAQDFLADVDWHELAETLNLNYK